MTVVVIVVVAETEGAGMIAEVSTVGLAEEDLVEEEVEYFLLR